MTKKSKKYQFLSRFTLIQQFIFIIILFGGLMLIGTSLITHYEVQKNFDNINRVIAEGNSENLQLQINGYKERLNLSAYEWADWDDTYYFIKGSYPEYFQQDLSVYPFESVNANELILINQTGNVILYLNRSDNREGTRIPDERIRLLDTYQLIRAAEEVEPVSGLVSDGKDVMMAAVHPVLRTNNSGPVIGTLVLLAPFDDKYISDFFSKYGGMVEISPIRYDESGESPYQISSGDNNYIIEENYQTTKIILPDISGKPAFVLSFTSPVQSPYSPRTVIIIAGIVLGSFLIFGCFIFFWFRRIYSQHLAIIREELDAAACGKMPSPSPGNLPEELRSLATSANEVVQTLQQKHKSLDYAEKVRQAAEIRWETLFNSAADAVLIGDDEGILTINPKFEELTGLSREEIIGIPVSSIAFNVTDAEGSRLEQHWNDLGTGGDRFMWTVFHKDGKEAVLDVHIRFASIDGRLLRFCIGRDCTNEQKLQKEQERALIQIDKNMSQLMFLNDEIRNPLNLILTSAELDSGPYMDKIIEGVRMINAIVDRLDKGFAQSDKVRTFLQRTISGFRADDVDLEKINDTCYK